MTDTKQAEATSAETPEVRVVVAEVKAADPVLAAKILKQVEFYFGNRSEGLRKNKQSQTVVIFQKTIICEGSLKKMMGSLDLRRFSKLLRWVEIAHIASFPKMKALTVSMRFCSPDPSSLSKT